MIETLDVKLIELLQGGGIGAIIMYVLVRDFIGKLQRSKFGDDRQNHRERLAKIEGKLEALINIVSSSDKTAGKK